jgi:hypothetical protein
LGGSESFAQAVQSEQTIADASFPTEQLYSIEADVLCEIDIVWTQQTCNAILRRVRFTRSWGGEVLEIIKGQGTARFTNPKLKC